jgi:hypothetical protein
MAVAPKSLARIAESSGFGMADVAFLAGLDESTVCRLWDNPDWLDRVKGSSLEAIVGVVPGVGEYVLGYSLADRRNRLADRLSAQDVEVDTGAFRRLVQERRVPEQYLSNALDTAACVMDGDIRQAAAHLARFWGREQDYALGFVFGTNDSDALLVDAGPLVAAASAMVDQLSGRSNSFHAIVAQANLMHHISRSTGEPASVEAGEVSRNTALAFRSSVIGQIMATNDADLAAGYTRSVKSSPLLAMVEDWAFPTYTHDAKPTPDFSLPRSLLLRHTADEVIREVEDYNDAYLIYLAKTSIPTIVGRDETFGLRRDDLRATLRARRERVLLPEAASACDAILTELEGTASVRGGSSFDQQW